VIPGCESSYELLCRHCILLTIYLLHQLRVCFIILRILKKVIDIWKYVYNIFAFYWFQSAIRDLINASKFWMHNILGLYILFAVTRKCETFSFVFQQRFHQFILSSISSADQSDAVVQLVNGTVSYMSDVTSNVPWRNNNRFDACSDTSDCGCDAVCIANIRAISVKECSSFGDGVCLGHGSCACYIFNCLDVDVCLSNKVMPRIVMRFMHASRVISVE
jgi:hypothetical protein